MTLSRISNMLSSTTSASETTRSPDIKDHDQGTTSVAPLTALSFGSSVLPGIPTFEDVEEKRQWQLTHMVAAFRHWSSQDYVEGISGHMSVRDPEHTDCFWMNPFGVHFEMLKRSHMVLVSQDGRIVGGDKKAPLNAAGFLIHAAIHKARPDVHAICHAHTVYGKAWSVFGRELDMLTQDACKFYKAHSVYDNYGGIVLAAEEGNRIAEALGANKACILRNHGLLTCGQTIDEAAFLFTAMEHACQNQILCESAARGHLTLEPIGDDEAAANFAVDSTPDVCFAEFQPYFKFESQTIDDPPWITTDGPDW